VIARLQRFYGGDPTKWLRTPLSLLHAYIDNITKLQAEEALSGAQVVTVGSGNLKEADLNRQIKTWRRLADSGPEARVVPVSEEEKLQMLARVGVRV
jgi:hypothetical protein